METLGCSAGFEIARDGDLVWMAHRRTRGPLLVALIGGGLALIGGANAVIWSVTSFSDGETGTGLVLLAVFLGVVAVTGGIAALGYRVYRRRTSAPLIEHARLRADLGRGEMQTPAGDRVAALADVRLDTPFNYGDSTRGSMRWIRLRWPGGSARVFTAGKKEAERVATVLTEWGVGHRDE